MVSCVFFATFQSCYMKHTYPHHFRILLKTSHASGLCLKVSALAGSFLATTLFLRADASDTSFQDALNRVIAQSPAHYDPIVTPVPEADSFHEINTLDLLRKLETMAPQTPEAARAVLDLCGGGRATKSQQYRADPERHAGSSGRERPL